jgi:hypothetical protein
MTFVEEIDAAVARLERAGGLDLATGAVTPALVKRYHRRARDLRAQAQRRVLNTVLRALFAWPRRLRLEAEPTVSTVG